MRPSLRQKNFGSIKAATSSSLIRCACPVIPLDEFSAASGLLAFVHRPNHAHAPPYSRGRGIYWRPSSPYHSPALVSTGPWVRRSSSRLSLNHIPDEVRSSLGGRPRGSEEHTSELQ